VLELLAILPAFALRHRDANRADSRGMLRFVARGLERLPMREEGCGDPDEISVVDYTPAGSRRKCTGTNVNADLGATSGNW
jgi:hypothetical protein